MSHAVLCESTFIEALEDIKQFQEEKGGLISLRPTKLIIESEWLRRAQPLLLAYWGKRRIYLRKRGKLK